MGRFDARLQASPLVSLTCAVLCGAAGRGAAASPPAQLRGARQAASPASAAAAAAAGGSEPQGYPALEYSRAAKAFEHLSLADNATETRICWQPDQATIMPMPLAMAIDWQSDIGLPFGNTTYPGMYLPNIAGAVSGTAAYANWNRTAFAEFFLEWNADLNVRILGFGAALSLAPASSSAFRFFALAEKTAQTVIAGTLLASGDFWKGGFWKRGFADAFLQGSSGKWSTDQFAGEFIAHTFLAVFLEVVSLGNSTQEYALDLSGEALAEQAVLHQLKTRAVSLAPSTLLRARGHLIVNAIGPRLARVEINDPGTGRWLSFSPDSSTEEQWILAKMALVSLAIFVEECFHTGMHLFGGTVIMAAQNSLRTTSELRAMVSPQATLAVFALLEQASVLHSNHSSVFSGSVWDCDITEVWALTTDIARFFFDSEPWQILGMASSDGRRQQRPGWWAGGSAVFEEAVSGFASAVASALDGQDTALLTGWAEQLAFTGGYNSSSVATSDGLARLYRNMLFVQGICHTHMYATREILTPLAGWPSTAEMLPYLTGDSVGFDPEATAQMTEFLTVAFATASGFDKGFPELGDGPWPLRIESEELARAIESFQGNMSESREAVQNYFGIESDGGFLPSYYYPVATRKPFGFGITQTTYI